jgi:hypothetical protein
MRTLDDLITEVMPYIDTDRLFAGIGELNDIELPTDFDSFDQAAAWLDGRFRKAGLKSRVLRFPADGIARLGTYTAPIGFRVHRAQCELVAPEKHRRILGARPPEPNTAILGSGHTGPEGVTGRVVHIGRPDDFKRTDVRGAIVFVDTLNPQWVRTQAIAGGAAAVISSFMDMRDADDRVKWINTWDWQTDAWMPTARAAAENFPGVSITPVQGRFLKTRLAEGPVAATVTVEGAYFKATFPGVYAGEDGSSPAVAVLTGHMFELGVMDNASGVMASHWAGETVRRIRRARGLKRFPRGWRHFHSQECYGVLALGTRHPELVKPMFAHVDLDAMGTYRAPVEYRPGLAASNGFAGFLMRRFLEKASARTGYAIDTSGTFETNCTLLAEPALGGVPTCLLTMRDFWWHSSEDRNGLLPLNPVSATTTAAALGAWLLFCVSAGRPEAEMLLGEYRADILAALKAGGIPDTAAFLEMKRREVATLTVLVKPSGRAAFKRLIAAVFREIGAARFKRTALSFRKEGAQARRARRTFPRTVVAGPVVAADLAPADLARTGSPKWDPVQLALKAWADGTRTALDIARFVTVETGKPLKLAYVLDLFDSYARAGIVKLTVK